VNSFVPEFKMALYSRRFNDTNIIQAESQEALLRYEEHASQNASNGGIITGLIP